MSIDPPSKCRACKKQTGRVNSSGEKNASWPFCSDRCKIGDLGAWSRGDYSIPGRTGEALLEAQHSVVESDSDFTDGE